MVTDEREVREKVLHGAMVLSIIQGGGRVDLGGF